MFDHPQGIAPLVARLARELVHQLTHQKDTAAADPEFAGIEIGYGLNVERITLIKEADFQTMFEEKALDLDLSLRAFPMGMTDDVVDRFVSSEHDGMRDRLFNPTHFADGFQKRPGQRELTQVARHRQSPRLGSHETFP